MKKQLSDSLEKWMSELPAGSCITTDSSNIKFEESKSKITFTNESRKSCLKIQVDGEIVPSSEQSLRCDNLLVEKDTPLFCFIELKGCNIKHAFEQLESSLKDNRLNPKCSQRKKAFVVGRNHAPASSPIIQNAMKKFRVLNAELHIANTPATFTL